MFVYSISTHPGARFSREQAVAKINELSGRNIAGYILATAIPGTFRRTGGVRASAYVAASRKSPAREEFGLRGFHVRRESEQNGRLAHPSGDGFDPSEPGAPGNDTPDERHNYEA